MGTIIIIILIMAILTMTSGEAADLAVVKVTPVNQDCFTLYEYIVTTNQGDSVDIEVTGNHFEAIYVDNGIETSFSTTATVTFDTSLRVRFLLLNSGTVGVYSNATINITNTTTSNYYENFVERENDEANCYDPVAVPTKTSDLLNDGADATSTYVETDELVGVYLPLAGGTETGPVTFQGKTTFQESSVFETKDDPANNNMTWKGDVADGYAHLFIDYNGNGGGFSNLKMYSNDIKYNNISLLLNDNDQNASEVSFTPYLTITSTDVQAALAELKDEVNLLGATTIDSVITNGSTNPVENNAIYDEFQLVSYLAADNTFTGTTNTFNNTISTGTLTLDGSVIDIDTTNLDILSNNHPVNNWTFNTTAGLIGNSVSNLFAATITTDNDAYTSGWNASLEVPTKDAIYDKIESLSGFSGDVTKVGTPVDDQVGVWTGDGTIEGTTGLTYDGATLNITGAITLTSTVDGIDIATDVAANTAKVTNANHTGDVTGDTALTIAAGAVDIAMMSASGSPGATTFLRGDNIWTVPAGSGDVSKVGTPVNDQVGVWTGDGTIEGTSSLTFDGSNLVVDNNITAGNVLYGGTGGGVAAPLRLSGTGSGTANTVHANFYESNGTTRQGYLGFASGGNSDMSMYSDISDTSIILEQAGGSNGLSYYDGTLTNKVWHTGNDGNGSGLDADELRGNIPSTASTANTIVLRDAEGDVTAESFYSDSFIRTSISDTLSSAATMFNYISQPTHSFYTDSNSTGSTGFPTQTGQTFAVRGATQGRDLAFWRSNSLGSVDLYAGNWDSGGTVWEWNKLWHDNNDGSGSGLDADTVDGAGYTEGTFSPVLAASGGTYTYTVTYANYAKIGDLCTFKIYLTSVGTNTATGITSITGMPFGSSGVSVYPVNLTNFAGPNNYGVFARQNASSTTLLLDFKTTSAPTNTNGLLTASSGTLMVSGSYRTT